MRRRLFQCLFAFMLSGSAFADSGFYVGGEVGYLWTENPNDIDDFTQQAKSDAININTLLDIDTDLSSVPHGIFVGYWVSDNLTIEANYARVVDGAISYRFDDIANIGISAEIDRLSLSLLPFYKLNNWFDIYGRVGYARSRVKTETSVRSQFAVNINPENYVLASDSISSVLVGVGVRFHPNDHYYMRLEAQYDDSLYGLKGIVMGFGYQF